MAGVIDSGQVREFEALRKSEELQRAILNTMSDVAFLVDDAGAFRFICPNVEGLFGYGRDEVKALGRLDRLLGDDLFDPDALRAEGEIHDIERDVRTKAGETRTIHIDLKHVAIGGGTVLATCHDVTALRTAERALAATRNDLEHAARLGMMGQLTATIMHELNQPLASAAINAEAGLLLLDRGETGGLRPIFDGIREQSLTAAALIAKLRNLVRKRPLELTPVDLNAVVRDVVTAVKSDADRRKISLMADLAASLPMVAADRLALEHLIMNLVVNAEDAAQTGKREARAVVIRTQELPDSVSIVVSDSGDGIAAEHHDQVFKPFFTTKSDGLGLGLTIVRSIVEAHGGTIRAETSEAYGTTFRVTLPIAKPQALAAAQ